VERERRALRGCRKREELEIKGKKASEKALRNNTCHGKYVLETEETLKKEGS